MLVGDMKKAGLDPAFIFAFEKTGLLVSEENQHLIPEKDLEDWRAAIEEYQRKHSDQQSPVQYPMGTMANYGPDDKTTTKIAARVFKGLNSKTIRKCWVATNVRTSPNIQQEIKDFFEKHGGKSVSMSDGNVGCPHEEGKDYPMGEDCPFCPFWGASRKAIRGSDARK